MSRLQSPKPLRSMHSPWTSLGRPHSDLRGANQDVRVCARPTKEPRETVPSSGTVARNPRASQCFQQHVTLLASRESGEITEHPSVGCLSYTPERGAAVLPSSGPASESLWRLRS